MFRSFSGLLPDAEREGDSLINLAKLLSLRTVRVSDSVYTAGSGHSEQELNLDALDDRCPVCLHHTLVDRPRVTSLLAVRACRVKWGRRQNVAFCTLDLSAPCWSTKHKHKNQKTQKLSILSAYYVYRQRLQGVSLQACKLITVY